MPPDDDRLEIIVTDGAAYLQEHELAADVIVVDGYDAESQVEALSTPAFYRDCARALDAAGMLVVNLWGGDRNFTNCVNRLTKSLRRTGCVPAGRQAGQYRRVRIQTQSRPARPGRNCARAPSDLKPNTGWNLRDS